MQIKKTKLKGLKIVTNKIYKDSRGYFKEDFKQALFKGSKFIFSCTSRSKKNVLRGLHMQTKKKQGKFVSVLKGSILDVVVDLRKKSKTFGKTFKIILSEKNCLSLYIPEGFGHAYYSYEKTNIVYYKLSNFYKPRFESGINLLDKKLKINWPKKKFFISKKDRALLSFNKFCEIYDTL